MNTIITRTRQKQCLQILALLFLILSSFTLKAQDASSSQDVESDTIIPFTQSMSNYIMPLDKSFITTGLLADKAYPNVTLDYFNGETDSVITFRQWKQVHRQMSLASVRENDSILSPENLKQIAKRMTNHDTIPIALMNLKYNTFKPYALDSSLIVFSDGKFYDIPGRTESPYFEKRLFAATVYQDKIYNGRVTFCFSNDLFLNNSSESVDSVEIDFCDGLGVRKYSFNILFNNNVTVVYRQIGTKTITIRMILSDQTVLQTKSRINVVKSPEVEPDEILEIIGQEFDGINGTGKAYILYGCGNNRHLRKPIIVSDGFDPGNERGFDGLFELLNKEQFVERAIAEGFDFVILDYTDGADYIQRNAFVMVSLIETVNCQLRINGSSSKLIIIGPSMGGLITRYALNYMEQYPQQYDHNTGLYVSFDSPHLGANIPLGDQYWIDFFATNNGNEVAIESREKLNTIAAKQMLVYHFTSTQNNKANPSQERVSFLNDPFITNWPSKCRKIAVVNGSGIGNVLFDAHTQMIEYEYSILGGVITIVKGNTWAVPNHNDGKMVVFEGKIPDKFIFDAIPCHFTRSTIKINETQPFDGAPGGMNNVNELIANASTGGNGDIQTTHPNICFIPIISSLALNTDDVNYRVHDIPGYPYPSSNITPFDAIYAPVDNQDHVTVTEENIAWIMNEIGAFDMYLQNQTVNKATDFEARNTITTGRNVVTYIPEGEFVVKNESGEVLLQSEGFIRLKDGTYLRPSRTGTVRLCATQFLCPSWITHTEDSPVRNNDDVEKEIEEPITSEAQEWIPEMQTEKLPRNHPNPCRDFTTVEYELKNTAKVEIDVFNLMGVKLMTEKDNQAMGAGRYSTTIKTSSLPVGVYIGVVRANGEINGVFKMQVVR